MKKYIKSVFLMGIVLFHSAQVSAFGPRQVGECSLVAAFLARTITLSVVKEAAVQEFRTYVHPSNLWKKYIAPSYEFIFPTQFDHLTASEISGVAKDGHLQAGAQNSLSNALNPNNATPIILFSGPAGSGKSTAAKMIASQVDAHSYYNISKSELDTYCKNLYSNTVSESDKVAGLHRILTTIANKTPKNKKAVIHLEEFGEEFYATNPNIDLYKDFGTSITGDDTTQPRYSNVILVASCNAEDKKIHGAMKRRIQLISLDNPDTTSRIELFKKCDVNIQENAQKNAESKIKSMIDHPTIFGNLVSYFWSDYYNENQQNIIKKHLKNEYLVTDEMITNADKKYKQDIAGFEQDKKNATIPWTLATLFSPGLLRSKLQSNSSASFIDKQKIKPLKELGPITPIVTTNFNDMMLKEEDLNLSARLTEKDKAYILEKNPRFLAAKTKTKKENGEIKETSPDDINKLYKKADLEEQAFIADIQNHLDSKKSSTITKASNPALFKKMNLHRKYCSEALSNSTNKEDKKAIAKLSSDKIDVYTIDRDNRTYIAHSQSPVNGTSISSAPITFGAITTPHLAAAAYGGDFKSYEKQDAAAPKIQKLFKKIKAKNANLKSVIDNRIKDKKTYLNKPAAIKYTDLKGKNLKEFTRNAQLDAIAKRKQE